MGIQSQSQTEMRFLILIALFAVAVFETPEVVNVYEDEVDGEDETAEDAPLDPEPAVEPDADAEPEPVADAEPEPTPERGFSGGSFFGGIVFAVAVMALGVGAYKFRQHQAQSL